MNLRIIGLILILVLVVLVACIMITRRRITGGVDHPLIMGNRDVHSVGSALHDYSKSLNEYHIIGVHPLDKDKYEPLVVGGGRGLKSDRLWNTYHTWDELNEDKDALAKYFTTRAEVLNNPNLDWTLVMKEMNPKLSADREYIGIINLDPDGKTLRITSSEASSSQSKKGRPGVFATVPARTVSKYANMPGLFMFHTHPADPLCDPLPSSQDLSTAIRFSVTSRFAASVVISRYGIIVYGLDWSGYKSIHEATDFKLALANLTHDVVCAHESIRSWSTYTLPEYMDFYSRYRLFAFTYPSSEMVGDIRRSRFICDLESPIDYELIDNHRNATKSCNKKCQ